MCAMQVKVIVMAVHCLFSFFLFNNSYDNNL